MEFPSGHPHHHHHHRRADADSEVYPPPRRNFDDPPPPQSPYDYGGMNAPPPPTHVYHTSHETPPPRFSEPPYGYSDHAPPPPPPAGGSFNYGYHPEGPSPNAPHMTTSVHHVSHEADRLDTHHGHGFHMPTFAHHVSHQGGSDELSHRPTVKVYSKAQPDYSLTIRDGKVILALSDPRDESQHWYKDEKYSTKVKDDEGCPSFAFVNKAFGLAMKHSIGESHPVQLVPYNPDILDESVLWTESRDIGDGFRAIRMVNNVHLNVDAFHGDKYSGGVHDGTQIVLWKWNKGDNQLWKIVPY